MRPLKLTLQGFRSHQHTELDFTGRTLLAIVGPMGAGKSSILDGIAYALYAKTPRSSINESLISSRADGAAVELEFEADGRTYTVTRSIRRNGNPAHVLVDDGGEQTRGKAPVNARVEELLGLDFEAFCSSVMLPQGEFAAFLHAGPAERTKILKGVFRFEQIDAMREAAKGHARELQLEMAKLQAARAEIPEDVAARLKEARSTAKTAKARAAELEKAMPEERKLLDAIDRADEELGALRDSLDELSDAIAGAPDAASLRALGDEMLAAERAGSEASAALAAADKARTEAAEALKAVEGRTGDRSLLAELRADARRRVELAKALEAATGEIAKAKEAAAAAARRAEEAAEAETAAEKTVAELRAEHVRLVTAHAAHAVRAELVVGEPCPVCEQIVAAAPAGEVPAALEEHERREKQARAALEKARTAARAAAKASDEAAVRVDGLARRIADDEEHLARLDATLTEGLGRTDDPAAEIDKRLAELAVAEKAVKDAAAAFESTRRAVDEAKEQVAALAERRNEAVHALVHLAALLRVPRPKANAPVADLMDALEAIARAAAEALEDRRAKLAAATDRRTRSEADLGALRASLELGERERVEDAWKAAQAEVGTCEAEAELLAKQVERAKELEAQLAEVRSRHDVFTQLETDLRDSNFVGFLLEEKRRLLSEIGSEKLKELTGRYRFDDEGAFRIVDEFDGDKIRSVDTLSGGETFLASLALALALAEAVSRHGGRLQCFFLDEGFGSLDADALENALDGIDRIVSPERLIGLVSHVAGLADRIEDKIVLDKTSEGATVLVSGGAR